MNNEKLLEYAISVNPTRIELELTERCNLSCKFCYNSQKPIDSTLSTKIISRLADENVPEIVLTGGEPLLHPQFETILSLCASLFQKTMIQTNGTLISDSVADMFVQHNVFEINISLHGSSTLHDALTQRIGSYENAINAIKRLNRRGVRVSSNFVMTKENAKGLVQNLTMLYDLGIRCMTLTRFTPTGFGSANSELALDRHEVIAAIYAADEFCKARKDMTLLLANSIPMCALPHNLMNYCEHCHFGASRFYVDIQGNVLMCGMSRLQIGNIIYHSFEEIKRGSAEFAAHISGNDVPQSCFSCMNFKQCRGGCRAAALAATGTTHGADPYKKEETI